MKWIYPRSSALRCPRTWSCSLNSWSAHTWPAVPPLWWACCSTVHRQRLSKRFLLFICIQIWKEIYCGILIILVYLAASAPLLLLVQISHFFIEDSNLVMNEYCWQIFLVMLSISITMINSILKILYIVHNITINISNVKCPIILCKHISTA